MINKLYNVIIVWILAVLFGLIITIFIIPNELAEYRIYFWFIMFFFSNIISIYFAYDSLSELQIYSKKNNPKFYNKYLYSKFWDAEKWPFFFFTFNFKNEITDHKLLQFTEYFNAVRFFQLLQGVFLFALLIIFASKSW